MSYRYNIFISHAIEDRHEVTDALCAQLEEAGIRVWYSGRHIGLGRHLNNEIMEEAIPNSHYCVAIVSQNFLESEWTRKELDAFRKRDGGETILPVLHNLSAEEVSEKIPKLMDHFAVSTSKGLDKVVLAIAKEVKTSTVNRPGLKLINVSFAIILLAALSWAGYNYLVYKNRESVLTGLRKQVAARVEKFHGDIVDEHLEEIQQVGGISTTIDKLSIFFRGITAKPLHERNDFMLTTPNERIKHKKNVEPLGFPVQTVAPMRAFGFTARDTYLLKFKTNRDTSEYDFEYVFVNKANPVLHFKHETLLGDSMASLTVVYDENLRYVKTKIFCSPKRPDMRYTECSMKGLKPSEEFHFRKEGHVWKLMDVK